MKIDRDDLNSIKDQMLQLQLACYRLQIPMISVIQYEGEDENDQRYYKSITPALVKYDDNNSLIYDMNCLLSGNFKLEPIEDPDSEVSDDMLISDSDISEDYGYDFGDEKDDDE